MKTKQTIDRIKKLHKEGVPLRKIAKGCGVSLSCVVYHTNEKYRKLVLNRKNGEKGRLRSREWRKNNPEKSRRATCIGVIRYGLRRNIIDEADIKKVIEEVEYEKTANESN